MINLPIYRAFSETFDKYILGVPYFSDGRYYMLVDDCNKNNNIGSGSYPIDETTLSIHFPDMLDSKGNKIFASLQEDGKGGDKFLFDNEIFIIWFDNQSLKINATNKDNFECNCHDSLQELYDFENKCYDLKIIGIQQ